MVTTELTLEQLFASAVEMSPAQLHDLYERLRLRDPTVLVQLQGLLRRDRMLADSDTGHGPGLFAEAWTRIHALAAPNSATIDGYQLLDEVGSGGMGRVYRGHRNGDGFSQEVALKILHRECEHPAVLQRFLSEVQILAQLEHPGIARFIDAGSTVDGRPFVAMEFIQGEPIHEWCDRNHLNLISRIRLLRQVLAAVGYAHAQLIVHRDLKPGNVLVTADGRAVLLDFGIAKHLQSDRQQREASTERFLTPRWAAPEQLAGEPIGVGCDIHAIGQLLYLLLTGNEVFDFAGMSPGEIEHAIRHLPPAAMAARIRVSESKTAQLRGCRNGTELRRQLRGDIEHVVRRCLHKRPEQRYRSIDELDADLVAILERRPIPARSSEHWYRLGKLISRHRVAAALSLALALTLIAAIVAISSQNLRLAAERDRSLSAIGLLKEAFSAANPTRLTGAEFTARQVLDAARGPLEQHYERQPAIYADLAATLAEVEYASGRYREAAELAARAVAAGTQAGLDRAAMSSLQLLQARAAAITGDSSAAQALLDAAPELQRQRPEWLLVAGRLLYQQGQARDSIERLSLAVEITRDRSAEDPVATEARLQLAQALRLIGEPEQALRLLDETLAWQGRQFDSEHPRILITRQHRLIPLRLVNGAEAVLAEGFELTQAVERHFGRESAMAASMRASMAQAHAQLGHVDAAVEQYRLSLSGWRTVVGDNHSNTLRIAHNLANQLAQSGSADAEAEAEQLFADSIARGRLHYGDDDHVVLYWTVSYSQFLRSRDQPRQALALLVEPLSRIAIDAVHPHTRSQLVPELDATTRASGCDSRPAADELCHQGLLLLQRLNTSGSAS